MLLASPQNLKQKAEKITAILQNKLKNWIVSVVPTFSRVGSGAFPIEDIPSYGIAIQTNEIKQEELAKKFRLYNPPVFGRIEKNVFILDMRTLLPNQEEELAGIILNLNCN
jgi:L-seryl-tRNA(Ser) seleniumtransferase